MLHPPGPGSPVLHLGVNSAGSIASVNLDVPLSVFFYLVEVFVYFVISTGQWESDSTGRVLLRCSLKIRTP